MTPKPDHHTECVSLNCSNLARSPSHPSYRKPPHIASSIASPVKIVACVHVCGG
ncbi:hypothetical protein COLO4_07622 [Corchorus olitorius]|uniref:Uncharacterized protein n=1 Tax=Corchorus olitorius TaxID=93759 RepID=A0A1R3KJ81_9ROSI|nr:hypothetical protein COLO4_07622 [Corchorus olitorius]